MPKGPLEDRNLLSLDGRNRAIVIAESLARVSEKLEKAGTVDFKKTPHPEGRDKVPGSVDPRFPAGLHFPVPEVLEFVAFRDSGNVFQQFPRDFPGVFVGNPRTHHKQPQPSRVFCMRVIAAIRIASVRWRSYLPLKHRDSSSQSLRSLCCDSNRAIGVHSFNIRSTWNCGMACES